MWNWPNHPKFVTYVREREMIIADFTDTMQEDILYDITTN